MSERPLEILVAIDLVDGKAVRLTKGEMGKLTEYGEDPVDTAMRWEQEGAQWLHVVDLDQATGSGRDNSAVVEQILQAVSVPVELGGGMRSTDQIAGWVDKGVARVCVGTRSLDSEFMAQAVERFGDRLVASIDARSGTVQVRGWQESSGRTILETVKQVVRAGAPRIMFTDINRDGTLQGPNVEALQEVLFASEVPVIGSGGVSTSSDVTRLASLATEGLEGVVIGKALYSGSITLREAHAAAGG